MAALWKVRLRESTLTENYLVLPGQVLQPEAKGGVTSYRKHIELKSAVLGHTALSNRPQYHAQTAIITRLTRILSDGAEPLNSLQRGSSY